MTPTKTDHSLSSLNFGKTAKIYQTPIISKVSPAILWSSLILCLIALVYYIIYLPIWEIGSVFKINGFTLIIWCTVLFFSSIVSSFSRNYLGGFAYQKKFTIFCLGFVLSVMTLVMASHILPFILSWLFMGLFIAGLIGIDTSWGEAREASKFARRFFISGAVLLGIGLSLLAFHTDKFILLEILENLELVPNTSLWIASACIIVAATIQSAIYPFHRWLLSAMTAPTPASALMHAGFVNGSGIVLALLSTLFLATETFTLLFILGGVTAVVAQFTKLLQTNVKQKLACSTIAQMGFMIMQCGLGFFNAAIVHFILHGFYKAYLFLSSGEEIAYQAPKADHKISIKPLQALIVFIYGIAGAMLFTLLTGKTSYTDSSIFLTLIVAITVGQVTYNIVKQSTLSFFRKSFAPILLFTTGIVLYSLMYNGVTFLMADMPNIAIPQPLSIFQVIFGLIFLIGFFIMKLGVYRKFAWLYVMLLNASQAHHSTVLKFKNN